MCQQAVEAYSAFGSEGLGAGRGNMFFHYLLWPWGSLRGDLCEGWGEACLPEPSPDLDIQEVNTGLEQVSHQITWVHSGFSQLPGLLPPEMSGPCLAGAPHEAHAEGLDGNQDQVGVAQITFGDSAWSHPHQVNQNLWEVEPRKLAFETIRPVWEALASRAFHPERLESGGTRGGDTGTCRRDEVEWGPSLCSPGLPWLSHQRGSPPPLNRDLSCHLFTHLTYPLLGAHEHQRGGQATWGTKRCEELGKCNMRECVVTA